MAESGSVEGAVEVRSGVRILNGSVDMRGDLHVIGGEQGKMPCSQ